MAVGSAMMGPMVDRLVSPAGMRAALLAKSHENAPPAASALHVPEEPVIVRRNFSEFFVTAKHQPNSGLVFKRTAFLDAQRRQITTHGVVSAGVAAGQMI